MPQTPRFRRPTKGSRTTGPTLRVRRQRSGKLTTYAVFDGRYIAFGPADDPASRTRFAQVKASWEANGRRLLDLADAAPSPTVGDLCSRFLAHAETYYRRVDGNETGSVWHFKGGFRFLLALYRDLPAAEFDLPKLKLVRQAMIDARKEPRTRKSAPAPAPDPSAPPRYARKTINELVGRVVHAFRWGVAERLVPASVAAELRELRQLQAGRSAARETRPRQPVAWKDVEATLPHLSRRLAALVLALWHTGMRCGEAVQLRTRDVDMSGSVWAFAPQQHKCAWRGKPRCIDIGPKAQEALREFVRLDPDAYWFSPAEEVTEQLARRSEARRTPLWPSHAARNASKRKAKPEREPGPIYTTSGVGLAIARACKRADVPRWSAHQLRHAALSRIRARFGLEAAQAIGGHASLPMTEHYTREAERQLARKVAGEVG